MEKNRTGIIGVVPMDELIGALDDDAEALIAVANLNKNRTNPEVYRRFLEAANGRPFERVSSIPGKYKEATNDDVLEWLERDRKKFQDMFYKDARTEISAEKLETFFDTIAKAWVDGRKERSESPGMLKLFASIRGFYNEYARPLPYKRSLLALVKLDETVEPLLEPDEVLHLMKCNMQVLHPFTDDYINSMNFHELVTSSDIYVHRGMNLEQPLKNNLYVEKKCLVSWSVALSIAEQFSQTGKGKCRVNLSARLPHVWNRALIFTPFIPEAPLAQYELVLVPERVEVPLNYDGEHADIHEYEWI